MIVAQAPMKEPVRPPEPDVGRPGLREVPSLPLRFGRHLTAWVLWHTSRVSLISDAPPPRELDRTARV